MKISLTTKILLVLLEITIFPITLIAVTINANAANVVKQQQLDKMNVVTLLISNRLKAISDRNLERLEIIESSNIKLPLHSYLSTKDQSLLNGIKSDLIELKSLVQSFHEISIFDTNGKLLVSTAKSTREFERGLLSKAKEEPILNYLFQDTDGVTYNSLSTPLTLNGKLIGILRLDASAANLISITNDYSGLGDTGEIVFVGKNYEDKLNYLTSFRFGTGTESGEIFKDVNLAESLEKKKVVYNGIRDYRDEETLAITEYVENLDWWIIIKVDIEEAFVPVANLSKLLTLISIVTILVVVFISVTTTRLITRPILKLTEYARKIGSGGELTQKINLYSKDEIGELGETFNIMTEKLDQSYKALEVKVRERTEELEIAKAGLEQSVAARTVELEKIKQTLEKSVEERTAELNTNLEELKRLNEFMVDRELKMRELKAELEKYKPTTNNTATNGTT